MNKKEQTNKLIDEAISSVDNIKRASPLPFLLTRVNARLNKAKESMWEKALWFIGRPAISIPALTVLISINLIVVVFNRSDRYAAATEQAAPATPADELSYTVATIYDIENTEP